MNHSWKRILMYTLCTTAILLLVYNLFPPIFNSIAGTYNSFYRNTLLSNKKERGATTYYVNRKGNDNDNGKSPATAWQTISKLNQSELNPGDSILFEGGQTFPGNLTLTEEDLGTKEKPIYIGSYGTQPAIIDANEGTAIQITNSEGYHISKLVLKGSDPEKNEGNGIAVINNLRGDIKLKNIRIDSVEAFGFGYCGIVVEGKKTKSGFENVIISTSSVYNNGDAGLYIKGAFNMTSQAYAHKNIVVRNVKAYLNLGRPTSKINTGSGIVLSDTEVGLIENCEAYSNGARCTSLQGGPVGIWAWDAKDILIQYNQSYNNKTNCPYDGGGFDLDGGCINSILQYNYSHDNDGSGFFLAQFFYARKHKGNIVRYNVSENDGRKNGYAGLDVWGEVEDAFIYNNTILIAPAQSATANAFLVRPNKEMGPEKVRFPKNITVANNVFVTTGSVNLVNATTEITGVQLINNNYYNTTATPAFKWSEITYQSFEEWRAATHHEKKGNHLYGMNTDPLFTSAQFALENKKQSVSHLQLNPGSPLIDNALDLQKEFGIKPVTNDFNGTILPQGRANDIGAFEFLQQTKKL